MSHCTSVYASVCKLRHALEDLPLCAKCFYQQCKKVNLMQSKYTAQCKEVKARIQNSPYFEFWWCHFRRCIQTNSPGLKLAWQYQVYFGSWNSRLFTCLPMNVISIFYFHGQSDSYWLSFNKCINLPSNTSGTVLGCTRLIKMSVTQGFS